MTLQEIGYFVFMENIEKEQSEDKEVNVELNKYMVEENITTEKEKYF